MASPTTPTHGKLAAVYRLRPGGFVGAGLNDASWGAGFSGAASAMYEVVIDGADTPDTFKWRKNGGAWTEEVAITGAAQTLDDGQQITFAATTGHTVGDGWAIGNLKDEACTESGDEAQITDADLRVLNPDAAVVFSDTGSEAVRQILHAAGKAVFSGNVTVVTVSGNNGFIPDAALDKEGFLVGWQFSPELDMGDASRCGQHWKEYQPGQAGFAGQCDAYFIGGEAFFGLAEKAADGTLPKTFLKLFLYDPDQDGTGDHFRCWAGISGVSLDAPVGGMVTEPLKFTGQGAPYFVANS